MASDATTFFLSFLAVFGALGYGLWRFEQRLTGLRRRLDEHRDHQHGQAGQEPPTRQTERPPSRPPTGRDP